MNRLHISRNPWQVVFVLPLILVAIIGYAVWRAVGQQGSDRSFTVNRPTMGAMPTRGRKVVKRIALVVIAWAAVTGVVSFVDISIAIFSGVAVVAIGAVWVFRTADPMQIDMDELDRELMKLLEDET